MAPFTSPLATAIHPPQASTRSCSSHGGRPGCGSLHLGGQSRPAPAAGFWVGGGAAAAGVPARGAPPAEQLPHAPGKPAAPHPGVRIFTAEHAEIAEFSPLLCGE